MDDTVHCTIYYNTSVQSSLYYMDDTVHCAIYSNSSVQSTLHYLNDTVHSTIYAVLYGCNCKLYTLILRLDITEYTVIYGCYIFTLNDSHHKRFALLSTVDQNELSFMIISYQALKTDMW